MFKYITFSGGLFLFIAACIASVVLPEERQVTYMFLASIALFVMGLHREILE